MRTLTPVLLLGALALTCAPLLAQNLTNSGIQLGVGAGTVLNVPGAVINQAGATLTVDGTLQVGGDLTNAGTVGSGTGTIVFTGATDQTLTPGGASLGRVEVRNTGPAGQNRVLLPADLTITQQLTLTSGLLRTDPAATLHLPPGATLSGEAPGRYVQGRLEVLRTGVGGSADLDFGNGLVLNPQGNSLGTVRVIRAAGLQQAGVTFGQNPANTSQQGIDRIWTVVPDQQPAIPVSLTLTWLPDDDNGLSFGAGQVWRMPDGQAAWQPVGPLAAAAGRTLTVSTPGLSRWTVSNAQNPLPVELVSFTAERREADALLRWTTATEKNNDHFDVESSPDGQHFTRLGTLAGHGTSAQPHDYTLTDYTLARYGTAVIYYRLRQVDHDGTQAVSPVRVVRVPELAAPLLVQVYPNPFSSSPTVRIQAPQAGPATLTLHDATGRRLSQQELTLAAGRNEVALPAAEVPLGLYLLSVVQGPHRQTIRIVRK
jgi:hypothetical protein